MTREFQRNNPLGVSVSSSFEWENIDLSFPGVAHRGNPNDLPVPGVDNLLGDHLVVFKTMQDGANAGGWLLHDRYFQADSNTPESLGNKWAGDSQTKAKIQNRKSYGDSIASIMKDAPLQVLDYERDGILVMEALCREENGTPEASTMPLSVWQAALIYGALPEEDCTPTS